MVVDRIRRTRRKGTSGKYLFGAGTAVLALGTFTDVLRTRVGAAGLRLSVLELLVGLLGVALAMLAAKYVLKKVAASVLKTAALAGISVSLGLPPLSASVGKRISARIPYRSLVARVPGMGMSRFRRLSRAIGGFRGTVAGGLGGSLYAYGAHAGRLGGSYLVFGTRVELGVLVALLALPGAVIYVVRNA